MSTLASMTGAHAGGTPPAGSARASGDASAELAQLEVQLSDWVHCPSSKTSAGKAHIAEITGKIDAIKAQAKHAEEQKAPPAVSAPLPRLRLDGLSARLDVQA